MEFLFWFTVASGVVTVVGYPLAIIALATLLPHRPEPPPQPLRATLLIAAHNEEACIAAKLENALSQDVQPHQMSVVVVADGCTDRTTAIVQANPDPRVSLFDSGVHLGKIAAMQKALESVGGDVVIFSDANSLFAPGALRALLNGFTTPRVGGVCGALAIARRGSGWLGTAESLYWRYDNLLKKAESRLGGAVSAQGSLYAVRRDLLDTVPLSVADDFFISTQVVAAGKRLRFAPQAVTVEPVSNNTRGEFGRRVRSTERGWRGLLARRALLNPLRTGAYAIQLLFHKVLRRTVPLMLALTLVLSAVLAPQHWIYAVAFAVQGVFYGVALGALAWPPLRRLPGATVAFFFVETQIAMALGLSRVALGLHSRRWVPVRDVG